MSHSKNILSEKEMELVEMLISYCQSTGDIQTKSIAPPQGGGAETP